MIDKLIENAEFATLLASIDDDLAQNGVPPADRPFRAAALLEQTGILTIDAGNGIYEPDGSADFASTRWFAQLYGIVNSWYGDQFGIALERRREQSLRGVILIRATPFALEVPRTRVEFGGEIQYRLGAAARLR